MAYNLFANILNNKGAINSFLGNEKSSQDPLAPKNLGQQIGVPSVQPMESQFERAKAGAFGMKPYLEAQKKREESYDPTQSLTFKAIQGGADIFTGAKEGLLGVGERGQQNFDAKKEKARQFLAQKGYSPETIESTLGSIEYKPGLGTRIATGLGTRLEEMEKSTKRFSDEGLNLKTAISAPLSYAGDVVGTATEPIGAILSPVVQKVIEKTGQTENVQEVGKWWEGVRQSNPNFADAIEGAMNVGSLAPIPPIGKAIGTGAKATGKAIVKGAEVVVPKIKAIPQSIIKAPGMVDDVIERGVERIATKALGSSDGTAELFKATSPSYNVLAKSKDILKIKEKARVADEAVVEAGYVPKTTKERVDAYKGTMKKIWGDIEKARGSVPEKYKSDSIADTIVSEVEKMKVNGKVPPSLESDVSALLKEADFYRSLGDVSLPDLGIIRSNINARLTFGDKTQFSDAYNAVMKKVISSIKEGEDAVLTRNIGTKTSDMLYKYGSLRSMLDDVVKQDIKASRAKGLPIEESFGRIAGTAELLGGVGQLVMNPKQALPSIVSGGSKILLGKVAGKIKDPDYLIQTGYQKLLQSKKSTNGNNSRNTPVVRPNSNSSKTKQIKTPLALPSPSGKPLSAPVSNVKPILGNAPKPKLESKIVDPRVKNSKGITPPETKESSPIVKKAIGILHGENTRVLYDLANKNPKKLKKMIMADGEIGSMQADAFVERAKLGKVRDDIAKNVLGIEKTTPKVQSENFKQIKSNPIKSDDDIVSYINKNVDSYGNKAIYWGVNGGDILRYLKNPEEYKARMERLSSPEEPAKKYIDEVQRAIEKLKTQGVGFNITQAKGDTKPRSKNK